MKRYCFSPVLSLLISIQGLSASLLQESSTIVGNCLACFRPFGFGFSLFFGHFRTFARDRRVENIEFSNTMLCKLLIPL